MRTGLSCSHCLMIAFWGSSAPPSLWMLNIHNHLWYQAQSLPAEAAVLPDPALGGVVLSRCGQVRVTQPQSEDSHAAFQSFLEMLQEPQSNRSSMYYSLYQLRAMFDDMSRIIVWICVRGVCLTYPAEYPHETHSSYCDKSHEHT